MDLVDRICIHANLYCPNGCHDRIYYEPDSAGMELVSELAETWANTGTLSDFHASLDPNTGQDGLDEVTEAVFLTMHEPDTDCEV
jgi:hypothetical protein